MEGLWTNLRLTDVADIGILTFIIYRLLLLIRGTRAFQMVWGLLVLVPVYYVIRRLELYTLTWILDRFSVYLVLAIVVLFQEDIRRALARVGNPFFMQINQHDQSQVVEELSRACFNLAGNHVGALIALQREASLGDWVEVGVRLDALVSHELLQAIFQTTSPIHDGAVIIQKDRVAAAGCFLPLTTNPDVSKALGTRHRAALGLSDETDAVILVVSEEEGRVSLIQNGKIRIMQDAGTLKQVLLNLYSVGQTRRFFRLSRPQS